MESRYNNNVNELDACEAIDGYGKSCYTSLTFIENGLKEAYHMAIKSDKLILYPVIEKSINLIKKINIDDIEYFASEGEIYREQVISGGGSTGINVGGAILGDIIAGPAGMVLGGQRKVNEVKSKTVTHDTRCVRLSYFEGKSRRNIYFDIKALDFFKDNIPEKEYMVVDSIKKNKLIKREKSPKELLRDLKEMLDEGLITEEEYNKKRESIIDKM